MSEVKSNRLAMNVEWKTIGKIRKKYFILAIFHSGWTGYLLPPRVYNHKQHIFRQAGQAGRKERKEKVIVYIYGNQCKCKSVSSDVLQSQ